MIRSVFVSGAPWICKKVATKWKEKEKEEEKEKEKEKKVARR